MSNVSTFNENLPAHLQNVKLDDFTKAFANSGGSVKRITLRGRVFRLVDGGKEIAKNTDPHMDVVIVNGSRTVQKSYYARDYDPDETSSPDCWSSDGERPDADVADPQCARCKECPKAVKGSGSGGKGAACRFSMRLAVVLRNNVGGDIYQLILPQKSLFGQGDVESMPFLQYAKYVAQSGFNLNMMATRMSFDTDADFPKLVFKNAGFLDKDEYDTAIKQGESTIAINASKLSFRKRDAADVPKLEAPVEAASEPVKRAEKAKPAPAVSKGNLADIVDSWGEKK